MLDELDASMLVALSFITLFVGIAAVAIISASLVALRPLARLRSRRGTYHVTSATKTREDEHDATTYRIVIVEDGAYVPLDMMKVPWERTKAMLDLNPGRIVHLDMDIDHKTLSVTRVHGYGVRPASLDTTTPEQLETTP